MPAKSYSDTYLNDIYLFILIYSYAIVWPPNDIL